jgi:hypothetical protein
MRRALVMLVLFCVGLGVGPAAARADVVVTREGDNLALTSNGTGEEIHETVTLTETISGTVQVASPQGVEGDCVACTVAGSVNVRLGDGRDTIAAATLTRTVVVDLGDGGDTVTTGAGADAITVVGAGNSVWAGAGGDVITGAGEFHGEAGDDLLDGGGTLDGGPGSDRLKAFEGTVSGGSGVDSVEFALLGPVRASLDGVANDGVGPLVANVSPDVEILIGGAQDDVLRGADGPQTLIGGGGNDVLDGAGGADILEGGEGADTLTGGPGQDQLRGDAGDDELRTRDGEADLAVCGDGADAVTADVVDTMTGCERRDLPPPPPVEDGVIIPIAMGSALPPPPAAAPDVSAPAVGLSFARRLARRGLATSVTCSEACSLTLRLRVDARTARRLRVPRTLAQATARRAAAGRVRVTLRPRASVRRRLERAKGGAVRATLVATVTDAARNTRTVTRSLKLRA